MAKILITGSRGFIGKNLKYALLAKGFSEILELNREATDEEIKEKVLDASFIFNFAGENRPTDNTLFDKNNHLYIKKITDILIENNKTTSIMFSSSIQAELDNEYGKSKKAGENVVKDYSRKTGAKVYIYRFQNVFGKWSRPNYNSAVATFCYNISHGLDIKINDANSIVKLIYIDDVVNEMIKLLSEPNSESRPVTLNGYEVSVGDLAEKIASFKGSRKNLYLPDNTPDSLDKKLYSTYLSFLDPKDFSYDLVSHKDDRGSFTEILRTYNNGQFSVNVAKPGIEKGGHYHNTKNEKYLVVSGKALIKFRRIDSEEIIEKVVSEDKFEVIDIPVGYTHSIKNIGDKDLVTFMWANEVYPGDGKDDTISCKAKD